MEDRRTLLCDRLSRVTDRRRLARHLSRVTTLAMELGFCPPAVSVGTLSASCQLGSEVVFLHAQDDQVSYRSTFVETPVEASTAPPAGICFTPRNLHFLNHFEY